MPFSSVPAPLARALSERSYTSATPVQTAVLDPALEGRDMLVSAQTGSGKTVAFGLALANTLLDGKDQFGNADIPLALVIAPTRELALQVERELFWLYKEAGARIVACVGGMDPRKEKKRLEGGAHIVVGTPGRLRDHLERGALDLSALRGVVLDEADEMLDMGFREDLTYILDMAPAERRTLLFSATLPKAIEALAKRHQNDAVRLKVAGSATGHADIQHMAVRIAPGEAEKATVNLLREAEAQTAIVFCNTREAARHMQASLTERGFSAVVLSGELSQHERNQAMQALRDGRARVCVATDVAARGIDLPALGLVIHADLPHDAEVMQHRSGRTGRAGRKGVSAMLVPYARRRRAEGLFRDARIEPEWRNPPTADDIARKDRERFLASTQPTDPALDDEEALINELLALRSPRDLALTLIRQHEIGRPTSEEITDPGNYQSSGKAGEPRTPKTRWEPETDSESTGVWFRLSVGRKHRADPKWLLPMLCRRGGVKRADIGAIRIHDGETHVEIAAHAANRFAQGTQEPDEEGIVVAPLDNAGAPPARGGGGGKPPKGRSGKPHRHERPYEGGNDRPRERSYEGGQDRPRERSYESGHDRPRERAHDDAPHRHGEKPRRKRF